MDHPSHLTTALFIVSFLLPFLLSSDALLRLPLGNVLGKYCTLQPTVMKYYGIPFGQAPVGNLRFRPPIMYNHTYPSPYLDATAPPAPCCQTPRPVEYLPTYVSEDCLFMNVWAPADATVSSSLPVRVYVHGGNFASSHASEFELDGCNFVAGTGLIQVNIQYRLGAFGFLAHPHTYEESNSTGNWGIMDQQLALKWIQKHISYFGGDPSRVMLFGHSAGAWSVNILASLASSRGLFHAVVSMSSPGFTSSTSRSYTLGDAGQGYMVMKNLSRNVNCGDEFTVEQLECLRSVSMQDLLDNAPDSGVLYLAMPINQQLNPLMDGTFIPMQIIDSIRTGNFVNVPHLFGTMKDEGRFSFAVSGDATTWTDDDLSDFMDYIYPGVDQSIIVDMYPKDKYDIEKYKIYGRASDIWTDIFIACPNYNTMMAMYEQGVALYGYYMTHSPYCQYLYDYPELWLGATHGDDIYFVFGDTINLPPPAGTCNFTLEEVDLSAYFFSGFASMASNGYPSFENGTIWPLWSPNYPIKTIMASTATYGLVDFSVKCEVYNQLQQASKPSVNSEPDRPVSKIFQFMVRKRHGRFGFK